MSKAASQRIDHPAPAERRHWYLGRNGRQQGPFAFAEIVSFAGDETIDPNDLVWRPGLHNWVSVDTISGLLSPPPLPGSGNAPAHFTAPPPLPAQSRAAIEKAFAAPVAPAPSPPTRPAETATPEIAAQAQSLSVADETPSSPDEAETQSEATPLDALASALATLPAAETEAHAPAEEPAAEGDLPEHEKEKLRGLVSGIGILEPPETKASYFVRHWRGELPFATSLFVNGILLTAAMGGLYALVALFGSDILQAVTTRQPAFAVAVRQLAELREASPPLLRLAALALPWLAAGALYIWSLIGIFRSAINRL